MGRLERSWSLAKQSWAVLRGNPKLAVFPVVSSVAILLVTASFFIPLVAAVGLKNLEQPPAYAYAVTFAYYLVSYFVVVFFNAALIHCANEALEGRSAEFGDGIHAAMSRLGPIIGWSLLSATIGTILNAISERLGIVGQIIIGLLGAAWNIVTFFAVPMLVLKGVGPFDAVKGSWATIKKTWGETLIGNAGVSLAVFVMAIPAVVLIVATAFTGIAALIIGAVALSVLYWAVLAAVGACMNGIYTTAVFSYAQSGEIPSGFDGETIRQAFTQKPAKKRPWG
ncbi:MAG: DUF6159 family protein [Fimbriimonadaceae bacterium]|nr:hypothetical protein [Chthonomonadaceae bacterium]MCO5297288.1 DUF6159 family protein [Fimbriimonadaceae bacterium]